MESSFLERLEALPLHRRTPVRNQFENIRKHIQVLIPKRKYSLSTGMYHWGEEKFVSARFKKKQDELEIILLTDIQFGHRNCRVKKLIEYRDWILEKPNRFALFGGDHVDAWVPGSPGEYDNILRPDGQVLQYTEIMAPIADRILGSCGSNHGRRGLRGGVDLDALISGLLNIPYSSGMQMLSVDFGAAAPINPLKIFLWHGRGAARTAGGKVNMTLSVTPNDDAHVFFSGHIHSGHVYPQWRMRRDSARLTMVPEKYYVVSAASFLEFYGSYAEVGGYSYSGLLMPLLTVRRDGYYRVTI